MVRRIFKGYVETIDRVTDRLEILQSAKGLPVPRVAAVLDEKPDSSELSKGAQVYLVKDFSLDIVTKGEIVQTRGPLCSIKTLDEIVRPVGVNNVRLVKQSNFCPTKIVHINASNEIFLSLTLETLNTIHLLNCLSLETNIVLN